MICDSHVSSAVAWGDLWGGGPFSGPEDRASFAPPGRKALWQFMPGGRTSCPHPMALQGRPMLGGTTG